MSYAAGNNLLMLPFDHRTSFEKLFDIKKGEKPTKEQIERLKNYKEVIYEAVLKCLKQGTVTKDECAVLVDYQYGEKVLKRAKKDEVTFATCFEKSGKEIFEFQYEDYKRTIAKLNPDIVKVLVRMNPDWKLEDNNTQLRRLKELFNYTKNLGKLYLFELLVPATKNQLKKSEKDYDVKERPKLTIKCIEMIHEAEIEPDIWKLEGLNDVTSINAVVSAALNQKRKTGVIILGRGENAEKVKEWITKAKGVHGVIGFAVGRTVFLEVLQELHAGKISRETAIKKIAENYASLVNIWKSKL